MIGAKNTVNNGEDPARVRPIKTEYFWIQEAVART